MKPRHVCWPAGSLSPDSCKSQGMLFRDPSFPTFTSWGFWTLNQEWLELQAQVFLSWPRNKTEGISIGNNPGKDYIPKIQLFPSAGPVGGARPDVLFLTSFNPKFTLCGRKSSCFPTEEKGWNKGLSLPFHRNYWESWKWWSKGRSKGFLWWSLRSPPTQGFCSVRHPQSSGTPKAFPGLPSG